MSEQTIQRQSELVSLQKAASWLGVGVRTVYRYLDSGEITRSVKLPGKRLLYREDVVEFIKRHEQLTSGVTP
jgi:excisionase family DNA binding protein